MIDLSTQYLGLTLRSPVIVGSSGLTDSVEKIQKIEEYGAGAVVLKSIFEEEIVFEYDAVIKEAQAAGASLEQFDYYDFHLRGKKLSRYIDLIQGAKKKYPSQLSPASTVFIPMSGLLLAKKFKMRELMPLN